MPSVLPQIKGSCCELTRVRTIGFIMHLHGSFTRENGNGKKEKEKDDLMLLMLMPLK